MRTTVLVAPAGRGVGITTACLGIVRALDREGIRVAFAKPVANREPDHTIPLLSLGAHFAIPPAVPRSEAEGLLAAGDDQTLMERVVAIADQAGEDVDVLIVQGMHPEMGMVHSSRVNALMLKALDAELVLVAAPSDQTAAELAETVAIAARGFGALSEGRTVGCILNRICERKGDSGESDADYLRARLGRLLGVRRPRALGRVREGAPRGARGGRSPSHRDRPVQFGADGPASKGHRRRSPCPGPLPGRSPDPSREGRRRLRDDRPERAQGDEAGDARHHAG